MIASLDCESVQIDPIEISNADRARLAHPSKIFLDNFNDNIKTMVTNLKGKTNIISK